MLLSTRILTEPAASTACHIKGFNGYDMAYLEVGKAPQRYCEIELDFLAAR
jgi:hypothetical protein